VCVYCGSSEESDQAYLDSAYQLGGILAAHGITTVYGGGAIGSMGRLANGALAHGGKVVGVIPKFMQDLEWGHGGLTELQVVEDMRQRKHQMMLGADAVVALPGGSGTLEELLEAVTLKRLGIYLNPIVLVNVQAFFEPLLALFRHCIEHRFMDERHAAMWQVADGPEGVLEAIRASAPWSAGAREFATVRPEKTKP